MGASGFQRADQEFSFRCPKLSESLGHEIPGLHNLHVDVLKALGLDRVQIKEKTGPETDLWKWRLGEEVGEE